MSPYKITKKNTKKNKYKLQDFTYNRFPNPKTDKYKFFDFGYGNGNTDVNMSYVKNKRRGNFICD